MKKNIVIIILAVVALLLAGTVGYLVADKVLKDKYESGSKTDNNSENEGIKTLSLNDSLVTSLVYPKDTISLIGQKKYWYYKDTTVDSLGRRKMMLNASFGLTPISSANYEDHYSAIEIKNNFIKIFGPDTEYYDGDVSNPALGCEISKYDSERNIYIAYMECGGASFGYFDRVSKAYKAEQNGEYIYVYEYVKPIWVGPSETDDTVVYSIDKNDQKTTILSGATESNYESVIYQMMDRGEVETYKWIFKKQSDGKYYFYSGAWEN